MEPLAIRKYVEQQERLDIAVTVKATGLHIHQHYPFLAASPDGIVCSASGEGLLEVKCPFSKRGMTAEEACLDRTFCCKLVDGEPQLKVSHAYYYQVQGLLAVTGHKWCDFVIYTEHTTPGHDLHVHRIDFDEEFWKTFMLPGLLYFYERALIPEVLTERIKRTGKLHLVGAGHVPYRLFKQGFHFSELTGDLRMTIRRLT
ncbi:hypothetical protein HPB49_013951 [Dermacentor silvarum]|uniref:Uncharacterized protein n=1 Tax=Dermacentor silvarum TaxID=543639 RepID=A0ACB8E0X0_DERSI|nr:hypothetical protein HPB49_013951 [Dermacentor silvarum]